MIKPYERSNLLLKDLLNPIDEDFDINLHTHLVQIVQDERDPRFWKANRRNTTGLSEKAA